MNIINILGVVISTTLVLTFGTVAAIHALIDTSTGERKAPPAITADNVYVSWWTNNTVNNNDEVMFRVSSDAGATFGDKINLSNTTASDSQDAEISADDSNVAVTWWERNQTSDEPVAKISTNNGQTFGPVLKLGTNGTIGEAEEEG